ncbi:hypothetical protein CAEBREN_19913 [Caenorhabditis brenneri]|uniref:Uncharacterized protein n=1 Tax=Caenorhabditis brenneri TaxID=135651 RepID=G0P020_CAEBE|nr:hypothetical protein CAEBREN_19913 [Caenorhabditis brenneri]
MTKKFISFLDTKFNVFPLSPKKFIVYAPESIVQISFKTGNLPMPHSTGMYLTMDQNMGQINLFKENGSWGITEVYSSEKLVVPNEDVKLYEECGKEDYSAFSKFLEITHKSADENTKDDCSDHDIISDEMMSLDQHERASSDTEMENVDERSEGGSGGPDSYYKSGWYTSSDQQRRDDTFPMRTSFLHLTRPYEIIFD